MLSYNEQAHPTSAIQSAIIGTFMEGKTVTFVDHRDGVEKMPYPEIFIEAAKITM